MAASRAIDLFNKLGGGLEAAGLLSRNRSARELIETYLGEAEHSLQLEPALDRLIRACRGQADLTPVGRIAVRRHIADLLGNLARMQRTWAGGGPRDRERIDRPIFITGLPRTGSTLLHALLAQDPTNRTPASWEVMRPPTAPGQADRSIRYCDRRLRWARRLAPEFQAIHAVGATLPEECIAIHAYVFRSIVFHTTWRVPAYQDWLERDDQRIAYRFHRRFLEHLQYVGGYGRWILKAPGHMFGIRALAEVYPDATIVQTHRDPLRVAASLASQATVLRAAFSDRTNPAAIAQDWLERWWRANDNLLDFRERADNACIDVYYHELVKDPLATVRDLYAQLGRTLSVEARDRMARYLSDNPKGRHGSHRYSLEAFDLDSKAILDRLERYRSRFSIEQEPFDRRPAAI